MNTTKIKKIEYLGLSDSIDLEVDSADHNFYCNGIVVSNSHAVSYSQLTAATVYLKWKYPTLFFLEALRKAKKESPKKFKIYINEIITELPSFGIKLLPPDLVKSSMDFTIEGNDIRFGLSAIKGIAEKVLENLKNFISSEKMNKFQVFYIAKQCKLNIRVVSALIQSGCLDSLGENRAMTVLEANIWGKLSDRERAYCLSNGENYKYSLVDALKDYLNWNDGKPFKESRLQTIRKHTLPYMQIYAHNKKFPLFTAYEYESELLGYSYSISLKDAFPEHKDIVSIAEAKDLIKDSNVKVVAKVVKSYRNISRSGKDMLKIELCDDSGNIDSIMMGASLANYLDYGKEPAEGDIVIIQGRMGEDIIWCERLNIHDYKLAFKAADLKIKEEAV